MKTPKVVDLETFKQAKLNDIEYHQAEWVYGSYYSTSYTHEFNNIYEEAIRQMYIRMMQNNFDGEKL